MAASTDRPVLGKRRRWGWFFVVGFFVQALFFLNMMVSSDSRANRLGSQAMTYNLAGLYDGAAQARKQADLAVFLLGLGSIVCIVGGLLGFRRRVPGRRTGRPHATARPA